MARQAGPLYFTGTIDDLTFYKMEGEYFARKKSALNRRQFRTDPRFARSRKSAARFGEAAKLASEIYRLLPKDQKKKGVIGKLTGQVGRLLREGKTAEEILQHYQQKYQPLATKTTTPPKAKDTTPVLKHTSAWKITPNGKLIGPKPLQMLSTDTRIYFANAVRLNSYFASQRE